jgi:uncharacterized protein YndB with AHSA1/START domain
VAEYRLLTIWRIEAPLEKVYAAIQNSLHWPQWWPGAKKVEQTAAGDADGINNTRNYAWQGELPYQVRFTMRATRVERLVAIEAAAYGDLEGTGRWHFSRQGAVSIVRYEWHVRSTLAWMNLIAPLARPLFIRNHMLVMEQGGEGLARRLSAPLLSQENIDLMADAARPRAALAGARKKRVRPPCR